MTAPQFAVLMIALGYICGTVTYIALELKRGAQRRSPDSGKV